MKKLVLTLSVFMMIIFSSCKVFNYKKYAKKFQINYGESGGFTGATSEYMLKGAGELFEIKAFGTDTSKIKQLCNTEVKSLVKLATSKDLSKIKLNQTGNLVQFIKIYESGKLLHNFQWTKGSELPESLKKLHQSLIQLQSN